MLNYSVYAYIRSKDSETAKAGKKNVPEVTFWLTSGTFPSNVNYKLRKRRN
jgi:hypothetical protein